MGHDACWLVGNGASMRSTPIEIGEQSSPESHSELVMGGVEPRPPDFVEWEGAGRCKCTSRLVHEDAKRRCFPLSQVSLNHRHAEKQRACVRRLLGKRGRASSDES